MGRIALRIAVAGFVGSVVAGSVLHSGSEPGALSAHLQGWMLLFADEGVVRQPWRIFTGERVLGAAEHLIPIGAGLIAIFALLLLSAVTEGEGERHVRGSRRWDGRPARRLLSRRLAEELEEDEPSYKLHPKLPPVSRRRATRGLIFVGSPGSGKTQVSLPILLSLFHADNTPHALLYDNKGEITALLDGEAVALVAPWDTRGVPWDVSRDVVTLQHARTFAALVIPESQDPIWSSAARIVLVGIIGLLQQIRPLRWNFADILRLVGKLSDTRLQRRLQRIVPEAAQILAMFGPGGGQAGSKTGDSIAVNLAAFLAPIGDLARAWPTTRGGVSLREWVSGRGRYRTLILQGSQEFTELFRPLFGAMLSIATAYISSPSLSESARRQLYVFIDELPQLGRVDDLLRLVEVGRSKGVVPVYGVQDISQLRAIYGGDRAAALMSGMGTHVYCRLSPGETAEAVSKALGDRQALVWEPTISDGGRVSRSRRTVSERVVTPHELSALSATPAGIQALVAGLGDVFCLHWPLTPIRKRRPSTILAPWARSGNK